MKEVMLVRASVNTTQAGGAARIRKNKAKEAHPVRNPGESVRTRGMYRECELGLREEPGKKLRRCHVMQHLDVQRTVVGQQLQGF